MRLFRNPAAARPVEDLKIAADFTLLGHEQRGLEACLLFCVGFQKSTLILHFSVGLIFSFTESRGL